LYDSLWAGGVDATTLDACRDRIDALLRLESDPTAGRELSSAQRAAVDYAEQYALDPHGLRDEDFVALHAHFDDAQLATLTLAVAMFDALARFSVALEV
jgi:alkylhydroperoxidase family enzyme